jgi:hypothetical protein
MFDKSEEKNTMSAVKIFKPERSNKGILSDRKGI